MCLKNLILSCYKKILSVILTAILLISILSGQVLATNPKISIIIPVYNTPEHLLRSCLESAKNQTLKDIEIICIDDGSTNNSGKILDEYAKSDSRFMVVHQKNRGISTARNKGLEMAKGDYVQMLDSDDTIDTTMSEKCYSRAKEYDADIVKCSFNSENPYAIPPLVSKIIIGHTYDVNKYKMQHWDGIFRTNFLKENNIKYCQSAKHLIDRAFNMMCFAKSNKVICFSQKLYNYKYNKTSISHCHDKEKNFCSAFENFKFVYQYYKNSGYLDNYEIKVKFLEYVLSLYPVYMNTPLPISSICPELLQENIINMLTAKQRLQIRQIIQNENNHKQQKGILQ